MNVFMYIYKPRLYYFQILVFCMTLSMVYQQEISNTPTGECSQDIDLYKQHSLSGYHLFDVYISPEYPTECYTCMKGIYIYH